MKQVTLYSSRGSPFDKSVEIALKFKGISFALIEQDLFCPVSLEVRKMSPMFPSTPILVHNGEAISNASVIMEYIDETWKEKSIFPKNPRDRAKARSLIKFIELKCIPAVMRLCWDREWGVARKDLIQSANNCLKALENEFINGKTKYFGGDNIGAVDISAVFLALWAEVNAETNAIKLLTKDRFPLLCKWIDHFLSNNIVRETLPDRAVLLSFHRNIHPQDFRQTNSRRGTKPMYPHDDDKLAENSQQDVERLEEDSGDCYGIFRKFFDRQKLSNLVFPAEFSR